jgi:hypothetical protein
MTRSKNRQTFFLFRNDEKQKEKKNFLFRNKEKQKQTNFFVFRNEEKQKQTNMLVFRNDEKQKQSEKSGGSAAVETEEAGAVLTTAEESTKVRSSSLLVQFGPQRVFLCTEVHTRGFYLRSEL